MEEDVWFDYIREQFEAGTTPIPPHYMSHIDFMLSTMLGDDVRVAKPFNGFTQRDGRIFPVIIFYEDYIQDLEGTPISITRFTEKMIEMIRDYFQKVIKAEWVTISSTINTNHIFNK
jgi:hypothetical protein